MKNNPWVRATTLLFAMGAAVLLVMHGCSSQPAPKPVGNEMAAPNSADPSAAPSSAPAPTYLPATKAGGVIMKSQKP
ncbi:MAG: hypothetical protein ACXWUG_05200 [Polyangiales bacterium]